MESQQSSLSEKFAPLRKGLLEFLLLNIIAQKPVYVAEILTILEKTEFATQEGTLYPLLSRMRREALLDYSWQESEAGPPRKYYVLTEKGNLQRKVTQEYWEKIITTIKNI